MAEKTRNETAADEELKTLRERLKACEFLLIGLGSEWEKAGGAEVSSFTDRRNIRGLVAAPRTGRWRSGS